LIPQQHHRSSRAADILTFVTESGDINHMWIVTVNRKNFVGLTNNVTPSVPAWTSIFSHLRVHLDPRQRQSVNSLRQTNDVAGLLCLAFVQIIAKGLHPESLRRVNLSEAWWHAFVLVKASATMMDLDPVCWT
jgi:hypothetical protein